MGLMSKRSSAARQLAGSKRKRESKRRDFTGASSGCWARTAESVLQAKRRLKAAVGAARAVQPVALLWDGNLRFAGGGGGGVKRGVLPGGAGAVPGGMGVGQER